MPAPSPEDTSSTQLLIGVRDIQRRLGVVEQKLDDLPSTYVQHRELEELIRGQAQVVSRMDRFDEWRASMIESNYRELLSLTRRTDDAQVATQRRAAGGAQHLMDEVKGRQFQLTQNTIGWGLAILLALTSIIANFIAPHLTFH